MRRGMQIGVVLCLAIVAAIVWTPVTVHAAGPQTYIVGPGDTLWEIARWFGVPAARLAAANGIADSDHLPPGVALLIPPPFSGPKTLAVALPVPAAVPGHPRMERPEPIKALYITFFALGHKGLRAHAMELIEETELNAIVMDVKGDRGYIPYPSEVPLAAEVGAQDYIMIEDWEPFMAWFKERDVYTIARIVAFKDDPLATAHPEWAVTDARTGKLWRDPEGLAWTDPFRGEVWDYNIAIAVEAARQGFDEIQFDYLRFPTDGDIKAARFSRENTEKARRAAIVGFLKRARRALAPFGVRIAVDVFGYVTWRQDDTGIGQNIEDMAPYIDVLSPMLYPSTFHAGLPGYPVTVPYPYETVHLSTRRAVERLADSGVEVRPWIQDFPDYAYDRRTYTPEEIRAQMRGALEAGATGWMLWDPRVRYTREALRPIPFE